MKTNFAIAALFFAVYLPVIASEEQFLRNQFPDYVAYEREVPRLIPRLRRTSG